MQTKKEKIMPQIAGIIIALLGLTYTAWKDYSSGAIKVPYMQQEPAIQKLQVYPLQYSCMCYDPNTNRVWYLHDDNSWRDTPPLQKKIGEYYH